MLSVIRECVIMLGSMFIINTKTSRDIIICLLTEHGTTVMIMITSCGNERQE
jgi:hypothetical protein